MHSQRGGFIWKTQNYASAQPAFKAVSILDAVPCVWISFSWTVTGNSLTIRSSWIHICLERLNLHLNWAFCFARFSKHFTANKELHHWYNVRKKWQFCAQHNPSNTNVINGQIICSFQDTGWKIYVGQKDSILQIIRWYILHPRDQTEAWLQGINFNSAALSQHCTSA